MSVENHVAIRAEGLTVDFPGFAADRSVKRALLKATTGGRLARNSKSEICVRAIDNIDFEILPGERVGLYGHNGSGKTTLLRLLTGSYFPTSGRLEVFGRVASMLDITMGMEGDATGWENIMLRGLIMGMSPSELRKNIDAIGEFSGLGEYLNLPLRTYSSGMQVRLAFAVSTAIDTDILLLDEWLSVGDIEFQAKATERLNEIIRKTSITILASHSLDLLKSVCNRIFEMEQGKVVREISSVNF
jgi:lipopolysaccharide transport system ATP-binding protein